jgi:uncharacterized protein YukE
MTTIDNSQNVLDSRDITERIEELESEQTELMGDWDGSSELTAPAEFLAWEEEHGEELDTLRKLAEEGESAVADWKYGETLIRDSYFEEYAQELASDIGAIDRNASWPACHIDWKAAAESLQQDYTSIEFGDVTYWVR